MFEYNESKVVCLYVLCPQMTIRFSIIIDCIWSRSVVHFLSAHNHSKYSVIIWIHTLRSAFITECIHTRFNAIVQCVQKITCE